MLWSLNLLKISINYLLNSCFEQEKCNNYILVPYDIIGTKQLLKQNSFEIKDKTDEQEKPSYGTLKKIKRETTVDIYSQKMKIILPIEIIIVKLNKKN